MKSVVQLINEPSIEYRGLSESDSEFKISWQDRALPFYRKHEWNDYLEE